MFRRRPIARMAVGTAVVAGTATAVSGHMRNKQAAAAQAAAPAPAPAPEPQSTGPDLEQLKELAALHDQGILTDAEFDAQKAKILG